MKKHIRLFVIAGISLVTAAALYAAQVEKTAKPTAAKRAVLRTGPYQKLHRSTISEVSRAPFPHISD